MSQTSIPGELLVRTATPEDLPAIASIEHGSPEAPHWPASSYADMLQADATALQQRVLLVAEINGVIAGYAVAAAIPGGDSALSGTAELESIVVSPGFRRQGVGRRLGEAVLDWAHTQGAEEIHLEVRASNLAAYLLYEWLGFYKTGIRKSYYADPLEDAVLMTCRLAPL